MDVLEVNGKISDDVTGTIEQRMWDNMQTAKHLRAEGLGTFTERDERKRSNSLLITQLVVTYYLVKAAALAQKQEELALTGSVRS